MMKRLTTIGFTVLTVLPGSAQARPPAPIVPVEFRGVWDLDAAACASHLGDGRLTISARRVAFFLSEGPVRAVRRLDRHAVRLTLELTGEGETAIQRYTIRVSADGDRLSDVADPSSDRVRCHG